MIGAQPDKEQGKKRKARGTGDVKELPAAKRAEHLFRADLILLTYHVDQLPNLREHLQGERFVASSWVGEDWEYEHRDRYTEEEWERVCQRHGVNPAQEEFRIPISPYRHLGAEATPWEGLVYLIAVDALMNESIALLIEALHPEPSSVDQVKLYDKRGKDGAKQDGIITTLRTSADQLAKVVRGRKVRQGHLPGEMSRFEMATALVIRELADEGRSDEEIHRQLKEWHWLDKEDKFAGDRYTLEDVTRLRELRLQQPD
jgi:hypothetical protein